MPVGVLIVDDDPDMLALLRAVIESANEGLFVRGAAASGEDALELAFDFDPDVVVLDQAMPGLSGVELAAVLHDRRESLPIVLFTAYLNAALAAKARDAGVARCHSKTDIMRLPDVLRELTVA